MSLKLRLVNLKELTFLVDNGIAKYLSQNSMYRHYIIRYNTDNTFEITTYQDSLKLGTGTGRYEIIFRNTNAEKNGNEEECYMRIQYDTIYDSPHKTSPMNPDHPFYQELQDYTIGPFYTWESNTENDYKSWLPVFYPHLYRDNTFKILNFYPK